jgi:hypothetical protein
VNATDDVYMISTRFPWGRYPLRLFRINARSGTVRVIAGCIRCYGFHPGRAATQSSVDYVSDLVVDHSGNVLLPDTTTGAIWRLSSNGVVTRVSTDVCRFPSHSFVCPQTIAPAKNGTIYFDGELDRRVIEALNPATDKVSIIAGGGHCDVNRYFFCGNNILATKAKLAGTGDIAVSNAGDLLLVDVGIVQRARGCPDTPHHDSGRQRRARQRADRSAPGRELSGSHHSD